MKIKVTNDKKELKDRKYPYLGVSEFSDGDYRIIFFYKRNTGFVIWDNSKFYGVGFQSCEWKEESFDYFAGTLTMENEP